ncbi:hypothetical protein [Streptomyces sp. NPDC002520]
MLIYEYLPHELARLGVVASAAGLDRHHLAAQVRLARERADKARAAPPEPHHLSELYIAQTRCLQWERIADLMAEEQMAAYTSSRDPRAVRYEQQRLQRLMEDVAEVERSGVTGPEICRHRVYRVDARSTAGCSGPDTAVPVVHLMAASADEAAERAWALHGKDGGLYQRGSYRIASVEQVLPEPGEIF